MALWTDIEIPQARRPERDMAPCWICNEGRSKWLHGGTLIWSAASERLYAIGPKCYNTHFNNSLDVALNLLRRTQQEALNAQRLTQALINADTQLAWCAQHVAGAELAERLHADLAKAAPKFRRSVSRQLKSASVSVRGSSVLRGSWALVAKLREGQKAWSELLARAGAADRREWSTQLAPRQVEERLQDIRRAQAALQVVFARMTEAAEFTAGENLRSLGTWSRAAILPFTVSTTATQFEIRCEDEYFRGRANLAQPAALPVF